MYTINIFWAANKAAAAISAKEHRVEKFANVGLPS
jgi:hypothetical protein